MSFQEKDAELFKNLLAHTGAPVAEDHSLMAPGTILKGRIVEITKDHVVVDVGLKSEGLVPIEEFSDPSVLALDNEVEVCLDQPKMTMDKLCFLVKKQNGFVNGNIILEHCEEGSIVKGKRDPQSQRRLDGRYRNGSLPTRFSNRQ